MFNRSYLGIAAAFAMLAGAMSTPAALQAEPRATRQVPLEQMAALSGIKRSRGHGGRYLSRSTYRNKPPTTVAAEKRKATKRRNRLRHKARCRA